MPAGERAGLVGNQRHERGHREVCPKHGGRPDQIALSRPEPVEASGEQCLHGGRDRDLTFLTQGGQHLLREQWVPLSGLDDASHGLRWKRPSAEPVGYQLLAVV